MKSRRWLLRCRGILGHGRKSEWVLRSWDRGIHGLKRLSSSSYLWFSFIGWHWLVDEQNVTSLFPWHTDRHTWRLTTAADGEDPSWGMTTRLPPLSPSTGGVVTTGGSDRERRGRSSSCRNRCKRRRLIWIYVSRETWQCMMRWELVQIGANHLSTHLVHRKFTVTIRIWTHTAFRIQTRATQTDRQTHTTHKQIETVTTKIHSVVRFEKLDASRGVSCSGRGHLRMFYKPRPRTVPIRYGGSSTAVAAAAGTVRVPLVRKRIWG